MAFMQWTSQMSVGLDQLDEDHRHLIKIINDLADASGAAGEIDALRQSLQSLLRYAEFHFAREEGVMRACGYHTLQVHQDEFWVSRAYRLSPDAKPGLYEIRGFLLYQVCDQRICSIPLKSWFNEQITVLNRQ